MKREPKLLILLALLCVLLACATAPSLNMDANGNALIEVLERHDRMLTVLERLEAQGQLEAIDPALSPPEFALFVATWRTQSEILALAARRSMVPK